MSNYRVQAMWFYLVVIFASLGLAACGSVEAGIESPTQVPDVESISPTATQAAPAATPLPAEEANELPSLGGIPVAGWLGNVVSLPEGAQFDDYVVIENAGEFGIEGTTSEVQGQIVALRDKEEPGKYANFWGTLVCDVPDYMGCQLVVERIRSGIEVTEPEPIEGWQGIIASMEEPAQFDDAFVLEGDYPVRFGIASAIAENGVPIYAEELEARRDSGSEIQVWGEMICGVPDVNGCQIQVERIEENGIGVSPYEGWMQYTNQDYSFSFYYPSSWTLEDVPEHVVAEGQPLAGNMIELQKGDTLLAIGYKHVSEERIFWTGMPAGDFEDRGAISFFGQEMLKEVLVLDGKAKMITFPFTTVDDVVFAIRLDNRSSDYAVVDIPIEIQDEADKILSSFELMK
jgi:hypothetical protein